MALAIGINLAILAVISYVFAMAAQTVETALSYKVRQVCTPLSIILALVAPWFIAAGTVGL